MAFFRVVSDQVEITQPRCSKKTGASMGIGTRYNDSSEDPEIDSMRLFFNGWSDAERTVQPIADDSMKYKVSYFFDR